MPIGTRLTSAIGCVSLLALGLIGASARAAYATAPGMNGVIAGIGSSDPVLFDTRDGSRTTLLRAGNQESDPAWSPTGDRLAVTSGGNLVTVNADGTGEKTLVAGGCGGRHPTWSPDATQIAYATCTGLAIVDANGTVAAPVANGDGFFQAQWSPDGQWIAGARYSGDNYDIWKIHPDGGGLTQVTNLPGEELSPTWSPDGDQLAFEDRPTADIPSHIARVSSSGGAVTNLTPGHGRDYEPSWSPDGNRIVFVRSGLNGGLETQADVAALSSRVDTLTADLQNEAQTREVVDNSFTNMFQDTATALDGERLDALQADVQQQITATQDELSQETELKLQEAMQRDLKMQQSLSNILKKMSDTEQAITNNLK